MGSQPELSTESLRSALPPGVRGVDIRVANTADIKEHAYGTPTSSGNAASTSAATPGASSKAPPIKKVAASHAKPGQYGGDPAPAAFCTPDPDPEATRAELVRTWRAESGATYKQLMHTLTDARLEYIAQHKLGLKDEPYYVHGMEYPPMFVSAEQLRVNQKAVIGCQLGRKRLFSYHLSFLGMRALADDYCLAEPHPRAYAFKRPGVIDLTGSVLDMKVASRPVVRASKPAVTEMLLMDDAGGAIVAHITESDATAKLPPPVRHRQA